MAQYFREKFYVYFLMNPPLPLHRLVCNKTILLTALKECGLIGPSYIELWSFGHISLTYKMHSVSLSLVLNKPTKGQ